MEKEEGSEGLSKFEAADVLSIGISREMVSRVSLIGVFLMSCLWLVF